MELLKTGVVLHDPRKREPGSRPQLGDVAHLASGRLVARCRAVFEDGTAAYGCRDYSPDERPETAPRCPTPRDWSAWIDHEASRVPDRYRELRPTDFLSEAELEFARFRREWRHVSAAIGLDAPPAMRTLFKVGKVVYATRYGAGPDSDNPRWILTTYDIAWRRLLERHTAGDFGLYGQYDDAPLTDEEVFTLAEQPVVVVNKHAIATQSGPIRSRFVLPDAMQREKGKVAVVEVVTQLSPGRGPRTLMSVDYVEATS